MPHLPSVAPDGPASLRWEAPDPPSYSDTKSGPHESPGERGASPSHEEQRQSDTRPNQLLAAAPKRLRKLHEHVQARHLTTAFSTLLTPSPDLPTSPLRAAPVNP